MTVLQLALFEYWWKEHYGKSDVHDINKHYIVDEYIDFDEFKNIDNMEKIINNMRSTQLKKPIYKHKKLQLGIVKGFNYNNYEVCINYTYRINIFLKKCKKYLIKKKIEKDKNIKYTKKLPLNNNIIRNINKYY